MFFYAIIDMFSSSSLNSKSIYVTFFFIEVKTLLSIYFYSSFEGVSIYNYLKNKFIFKFLKTKINFNIKKYIKLLLIFI